MGIDHQKYLCQQKAEIFQHSDFDRQKAIASWPMMVMDVARAMNYLLKHYNEVNNEPSSENMEQTVRNMEKQIRESFIKTFGHDMIPLYDQGLNIKEEINQERGVIIPVIKSSS